MLILYLAPNYYKLTFLVQCYIQVKLSTKNSQNKNFEKIQLSIFCLGSKFLNFFKHEIGIKVSVLFFELFVRIFQWT